MPYYLPVFAEFHGRDFYNADFAQNTMQYKESNTLTHILCFPECSLADHSHRGECCRPVAVSFTVSETHNIASDLRNISYIGEIVRASEQHLGNGINPSRSEKVALEVSPFKADKFRGIIKCHKVHITSSGTRMLSVTVYFNIEGMPYSYARPTNILAPQQFLFKVSLFGTNKGVFYRLGCVFSPKFSVYRNIPRPSPCMTVRPTPLCHSKFINGMLVNPPGSAYTINIRIEDERSSVDNDVSTSSPSIAELLSVHEAYMNLLYERILPLPDIIEEGQTTDQE
mmetsp:Transcript_11381/g.11408  ORF Transcript_11381/g.11408 Transcript_11381/m.11408 type:complete len:283 (+) Transcript_11381:88-936(+)